MRTLKEIDAEIDRLKKERERLSINPEVGQVWSDVDCGKYIISYMRGVGYFATFEDGTTSKAYGDLSDVKQSIIEDGNYFIGEHAVIEEGL